ncbi:hypothetical protein J2847_003675 [Azospirillum agricola]|uniref:hypothetical protein n=1 Tax=Azospirillum agricola TaxID=1720247 RepID=UPI001AE98316|nr:hypothetical protein [Azospirillum agricola]MBP2230372.1 hypothetical protein [Azospirillum agricola]
MSGAAASATAGDASRTAAFAALTRAIDRAATAGDAAAIRDRAAALGLPPGPEPPLPLDVLARFAPADLRAHLWAQFGAALDGAAAPILCDHLLAVLADPAAGPPDAVTAADTLAALARRHGPRRTPLHERIDRTATRLTDQARRSTDHLRELLDAPDFPDLRALSLDLLRIEGARWVLEILGHRPALAALSDHGRRLSRLTLRRAAASIRAFIGKPDLLALYDTLAIVSQTDNLLTVAARLLDALRDGEEERTHFVTPDDESALRGFGAALTELADLLGRIALKAAGRADVPPALAVSALEQLRFLHRFSKRLGPGRPSEYIALERILHRHALAVAARFKAGADAGAGAATPGTPHPLEPQARALSSLLAALEPDGAAGPASC